MTTPPTLPVRIEAGAETQGKERDIALRVAETVGRLATGLGLDLRPAVDVASDKATDAPRIYVNHTRAWYSRESSMRARLCALPDAANDASVWVAALVEAVLVATPQLLATDAVIAPLAKDLSVRTEELAELVRFVLDMGVSIEGLRDRPDLVRLVPAPAGRWVERSERFLSGLHPRSITLMLHPRDIEDLLALDAQADQRPFAIVHRRAQLELGLPLPSVRIDVGGVRRGCYRLRINQVQELVQPLPAGEVFPFLAKEMFDAVAARAHRLVERAEVDRWCLALNKPSQRAVLAASKYHDDLPRVLRGFLREGVSIRDLSRIIDRIVDYQEVTVTPLRNQFVMSQAFPVAGKLPRVPARLIEWVRISVGTAIRDRVSGPRLRALAIAPNVEDALQEDVLPDVEDALIAAIASHRDRSPDAIVTSLECRAALRAVCAAAFPELAILSVQELPPATEIVRVGTLELPNLEAPAPVVAKATVKPSSTQREGFGLLLANVETGMPALVDLLTDEEPPAKAPDRLPKLATLAADPLAEHDSLREQGWAIVIPEGERGKELQEAIAPLIALRQAQGADFAVLAVTEADSRQPGTWLRVVFEELPQHRRPRYVLILGTFEEVSLELQLALAPLACVGRLAFDRLDDYRAYAVKASLADSRGRDEIRTSVFSPQDGSRALEIASTNLVTPCMSRMNDLIGAQRWRLSAPQLVQEGKAELLEAACNTDLLFSVSHGAGSQMSYKDRLARQGALLTRRGEFLDADDVSGRPFVPYGVWFLFACYGVGTPRTSSFAPWIDGLHKHRRLADRDRALIEAGQLKNGEEPFVAALPSAALANIEGPLAVIGHVDLAWSYAFTQDGKSRFDRIFAALRVALRGMLVGVALEQIVQTCAYINDQVMELYAQRTRPNAPEVNPRELSRLWMLRQDLRSFILLGDPAVRLHLKERRG